VFKTCSSETGFLSSGTLISLPRGQEREICFEDEQNDMCWKDKARRSVLQGRHCICLRNTLRTNPEETVFDNKAGQSVTTLTSLSVQKFCTLPTQWIYIRTLDAILKIETDYFRNITYRIGLCRGHIVCLLQDEIFKRWHTKINFSLQRVDHAIH